MADGMQFSSEFVHKEIFKRQTHSSEHRLRSSASGYFAHKENFL